jgi:glutathione peroxidase
MATSIQDLPLKTIDGADASLGDYKGKVLLIVNVASKCGLTPQYEGLEALYKQYRDQGLVVMGFPANDFGAQEPGANAEIQSFCETSFGVDFPMFEKIPVVGEGKHPLYKELTTAAPKAQSVPGTDMRKKLEGYGMTPNPEPEILWNFEKFLVGRDGQVIGRFSPDVAPKEPILVDAIEKALAS